MGEPAPAKKYAVKRDHQRFVATLRKADAATTPTDSTPIALTVTAANPKVQDGPRYTHLTAFPLTEIGPDGLKCHLQIWELDLFKTTKTSEQETDPNPRANRVVATFEGILHRDPKRKVDGRQEEYQFQVVGDPVHTQEKADNLKGKIVLSLHVSGKSDPEDYTVPMPEFETVFELAAVLRSAPDDNGYATYDQAPPFQVHNIEASLRRQIEERGGFAMGFVTKYAEGSKDYAAGEFYKQCEEMMPALPIFKLDGDEVRFGFYFVTSRDETLDAMGKVRDAAKTLLELEEAPRVATFLLYGHGMPNTFQLDPAGWKETTGSLRREHLARWVPKLKNHLSPYTVVSLFACSTGRRQPYGKTADLGGDAVYGHGHPCEELGGDSLGWDLYRQLVRHGVLYPTVWAHTTAAHTTRNIRLRVFSPFGCGDFVNVLAEHPCVSPDGYWKYFDPGLPSRVAKENKKLPKGQKKKVPRWWYDRNNLIRRISQCSAMYLPWEWNGGPGSSIPPSGLRDEMKQQVKALYGEMEPAVEKVDLLDDEVKYEDDTRRYIVGKAAGRENPQLSEHYHFSDIAAVADPLGQVRVSVQLLRAIQMLRYRATKALGTRALRIKALFDNGDRAEVEVEPYQEKDKKDQKVLLKVQKAAEGMQAEGLFTTVLADAPRLTVSVGTAQPN